MCGLPRERKVMVFSNESDRNEMALAYFQEYLYEYFMSEYNQIGEFLETHTIEHCADYENSAKALWEDRYTLCRTLACEDIATYTADFIKD
jgi:hypothetical protein